MDGMEDMDGMHDMGDMDGMGGYGDESQMVSQHIHAQPKSSFYNRSG